MKVGPVVIGGISNTTSGGYFYCHHLSYERLNAKENSGLDSTISPTLYIVSRFMFLWWAPLLQSLGLRLDQYATHDVVRHEKQQSYS